MTFLDKHENNANTYKDASWSTTAFVFLGLILSFFIKSEYKRQALDKDQITQITTAVFQSDSTQHDEIELETYASVGNSTNNRPSSPSSELRNTKSNSNSNRPS